MCSCFFFLNFFFNESNGTITRHSKSPNSGISIFLAICPSKFDVMKESRAILSRTKTFLPQILMNESNESYFLLLIFYFFSFNPFPHNFINVCNGSRWTIILNLTILLNYSHLMCKYLVFLTLSPMYVMDLCSQSSSISLNNYVCN